MENISEYLKDVDYPGRIIIAGTDTKGVSFVLYAITGRSVNSRNRILVSDNGTVKTMPYDKALICDPSLIIYNAVKIAGKYLICSNGDHTDTIADCLEKGETLEDALKKRTYEPDAPQYTPRIAVVKDDDCFRFGIIRREGGEACRKVWCYPFEKGIGYILHTYLGNGTPLPSFSGDPVRVAVSESKDVLLDVWTSLNADYRVAAYIRSDESEMLKNELEDGNGKA